MLAKHLAQRRELKEEKRFFQLWQGKLLKRIRVRMFFVKFLEMRGAKLLGIHSFKQAKLLTDKMQSLKVARCKRVVSQVYSALKEYSLEYCKGKREKAF